jgi:hypothetical protein
MYLCLTAMRGGSCPAKNDCLRISLPNLCTSFPDLFTVSDGWYCLLEARFKCCHLDIERVDGFSRVEGPNM